MGYSAACCASCPPGTSCAPRRAGLGQSSDPYRDDVIRALGAQDLERLTYALGSARDAADRGFISAADWEALGPLVWPAASTSFLATYGPSILAGSITLAFGSVLAAFLFGRER